MSPILRTFLIATAIPIVLAFSSTSVAYTCNETALAFATEAYIAAQTTGDLSLLRPSLSANVHYVENNQVIDIQTGILTKALKIDHRRTTTDLVTCATYTELIVTDPANPYVIGTQLRNDDGQKITVIDTVASTTNSWRFNATKTLEYVLQEDWHPIPEDKQDTRETLLAAGDAYMNIWGNASAFDLVPWGTPCQRIEGGDLVPDCRSEFDPEHATAPPVAHRRYVVDVSRGSVSILDVFVHIKNAADSHEFRLEGGKLRYVHTMTVCGGNPC
ncbi:hypothetical protein HYFRA_00007228 [Hymenoscyphus fraxineus]|uniref:DUF8021 domain-containing protein n=1 Tax=Hymenoscyphus fraxineus TaxID=746836 RepID=A0A9N9L187_9HELO|nr:hypothetical protein HYFRA_00007228 [Hymenoscyphus fraxineus]